MTVAEKLTKAANVVWGCFAYGLGCGLVVLASAALMAGERLMLAGDAAKHRSTRLALEKTDDR